MNTDPILIKARDLPENFRWKDAVQALRDGHELAKAEIGDLFLGPEKGTMLNRAAYIEGLGYAMKSVTVFDENPKAGLPTVQGAMLLFEPEHGGLLAVIESALVTRIKTAADSLLGAHFLARNHSQTLLILGAGQVAQSLVEAYCEYFPKIERVQIWARRFEAAQSLAKSVAGRAGKAQIEAVEDLPKAASEADIISTATMAREPILEGAWVKAGTHVDLIGAYKADMREADDALMARARIFVDSKATTIEHIGELKIPLASGVITQASILGDFYDLEQGAVTGRERDDDLTLFKNGGGAHLDLMIANYLFALVRGSK